MFNPYDYVVAMTIMIFSLRVVDAANWTETYIPYNSDSDIGDDSFGPFDPYTLDDPLRQHLHLFKAPSNDLTPVYIFAHSAGANAFQISPENLDIFSDAGYSVISWESVSSLGNEDGLATCWSDFDLVWSWFQANAAQYELNSNSVIIGGRSRGSGCSWQMAHSQKEGIQGIYMYNALPEGFWQDETTLWKDIVTTGSPPAFLVYGQECEKPITEECETDPDPDDGHSPYYGQIIVDRYDELGMASMIKLKDGLKNKNIGIFEPFPNFAAALAPVTTCTTKMTELCTDASVVSMKKCVECAQDNIDEIRAAGCIRPIVLNFCEKHF